MDRVLHGLDEFCAVYLDDVVIFSEALEDYMR